MTWLQRFHQDERGQLQAIPAILGALAKVGAAAGGIAAGIGAYQALTRGEPTPGTVSTYPALPTTTTALVPMTRGERERRQLARIVYGPQGEPIAVRRRRAINPLNPRALRRALRRAEMFDRFASRVGRFTRPGTKYRLKVRRAPARSRRHYGWH